MAPDADDATALGDRYHLRPRQIEQLRAFASLLERDRRAPVAAPTAARAMDLHIADALSALEPGLLGPAETVVDIGSGAGLPGLVLAIARPDLELLLLESQARKCAFIDAATAELGVANARAVHARAETWGEGRAGAALARAIAPQPVVLEYAAPLLREGGVLIDWRGRRDPAEERLADAAADELGMSRREVRHTVPYAGARDHHLHVFVKVGATPDRFPRRPGIASKRPLGRGSSGNGVGHPSRRDHR